MNFPEPLKTKPEEKLLEQLFPVKTRKVSVLGKAADIHMARITDFFQDDSSLSKCYEAKLGRCSTIAKVELYSISVCTPRKKRGGHLLQIITVTYQY